MTTNPSLLKKANITAQDLYDQLSESELKSDFFFFHQVIYGDPFINKRTDGPLIIYKVPLIDSQYYYIKELKEMGHFVCGTMTYDVVQLQTAINFGIDYSIILYHKNENKSFPWDAVSLRNSLDKHIKLIGASFRTKEEVSEAIMDEMDYVTVPPNVLELCFNNEQAQSDYDKLYT
jgi:hypothetical protein